MKDANEMVVKVGAFLNTPGSCSTMKEDRVVEEVANQVVIVGATIKQRRVKNGR